MFSRGNEDEDLGFENWHRVDFETVCQYTGLTDENRTKIFEGDIVKFGKYIYKITFECGSFAFSMWK